MNTTTAAKTKATKTPTRKGWAPIARFSKSYALPDGTQHAITTYDDFDYIEAAWAAHLGSQVEAEAHEEIEHRGGTASTAGHTWLPIMDADETSYEAWLQHEDATDAADADAEAEYDDWASSQWLDGPGRSYSHPGAPARAAYFAPTKPYVAPAAEGMYRKDGTVYKVQRAVNGSGNLYAKVLVADGEGKAHFDYAPGAIRRLSAEDRMTRDEAAEWGHLYGTCCVCGRTLTDETSIEQGIGPICSGREWGE